MPLVLAAIDLKLSSTREEVAFRQKRLNCLSRIIRHSETLFDVTDFVAAGTNRLLQMAYKTTENFFLSGANSPITGGNPALDDGKELTVTPNHVPQPRSITSTRAKSWLDAFIRYPRAYLFISTSVDHCLSVGRMPYGNALPALVRDIPAMGSMPQLPRKIDLYPPDQVNTTSWPNRSFSHIQKYRSGSVESRSTIRTVTTDEVDDRLPSKTEANGFTWGQQANLGNTWDPHAQLVTSMHRSGADIVNLDFLDLGNDIGHGIPIQDQAPASNYNYLDNFSMGPIPSDLEPLQPDDNNIDLEGYMNDTNVAASYDTLLYNSLSQDSIGESQSPVVGQ